MGRSRIRRRTSRRSLRRRFRMSGSLGSSPDIRRDEPFTNGPVLGDVVLSPAWSCSARQGGLRVAPGSSGARDLFVSEARLWSRRRPAVQAVQLDGV
jgi:hypothetical protein